MSNPAIKTLTLLCKSSKLKGNVGDGNERSQLEMSVQDDVSGRQRGDKTRRRRNNSNTARNKEDKNEFNQREDRISSHVRQLLSRIYC